MTTKIEAPPTAAVPLPAQKKKQPYPFWLGGKPFFSFHPLFSAGVN